MKQTSLYLWLALFQAQWEWTGVLTVTINMGDNGWDGE